MSFCPEPCSLGAPRSGLEAVRRVPWEPSCPQKAHQSWLCSPPWLPLPTRRGGGAAGMRPPAPTWAESLLPAKAAACEALVTHGCGFIPLENRKPTALPAHSQPARSRAAAPPLSPQRPPQGK